MRAFQRVRGEFSTAGVLRLILDTPRNLWSSARTHALIGFNWRTQPVSGKSNIEVQQELMTGFINQCSELDHQSTPADWTAAHHSQFGFSRSSRSPEHARLPTNRVNERKVRQPKYALEVVAVQRSAHDRVSSGRTYDQHY